MKSQPALPQQTLQHQQTLQRQQNIGMSFCTGAAKPLAYDELYGCLACGTIGSCNMEGGAVNYGTDLQDGCSSILQAWS